MLPTIKGVCRGLVLAALLGMMSVSCQSRGAGFPSFDVSPVADQIVFSSDDQDLFLLDLASSSVSRLTDTPMPEVAPAFSPNGQFVSYSAGERAEGASIYVVRILDGNVRRLTWQSGVHDTFPAFAPDGQSIAFARAHLYRATSMGGMRWNDWDVCIVRLSDASSRCVTKHRYYSMGRPEFAGSERVYFAAPGERMELEIFTVKTSGEEQPIPLEVRPEVASGDGGGAWASDPRISPDKKHLVLISDRHKPFVYDVLVMDLETRISRSLDVVDAGSFNLQPAFSRDGRTVYYLTGHKVQELWAIGTDGRNLRRIAANSLFRRPLAVN